MNRKDTIIVAALINAGLLIVLFVSALKNPEASEKISLQKESAPLISQESIAFVETKKVIGDEVDLVLKQYSQKDPLEVPVAVSVPPSTSNFVDDLQGMIASAPLPAQAPVEASPSFKEETNWIEVKVKKGDMLEKLARQHRTSVSEIMKVNNLSNTQLKIGQVLKIASSSKETPSVPKAQVAVLDATPSKFYTVKTGDSPWTIAVKNHMKVEELLKLNNMSEEKARRLKPGDQIRIR